MNKGQTKTHAPPLPQQYQFVTLLLNHQSSPTTQCVYVLHRGVPYKSKLILSQSFNFMLPQFIQMQSWIS